MNTTTHTRYTVVTKYGVVAGRGETLNAAILDALRSSEYTADDLRAGDNLTRQKIASDEIDKAIEAVDGPAAREYRRERLIATLADRESMESRGDYS